MPNIEWSDKPIAMLNLIHVRNTYGTSRSSPDRMMVSKSDGPVVSHRKLRLFTCACARQIWDLLPDPDMRMVVEAAEYNADHECDSGPTWGSICDNTKADLFQRQIAHCCIDTYDVMICARCMTTYTEDFVKPGTLITLLHDIVGDRLPVPQLPRVVVGTHTVKGGQRRIPKFVPYPMLPDVGDHEVDVYGCPWLTETVVSLAQAAYAERPKQTGELDNISLSVLADALDDAGCADDSILSHLRSPVTHVRGCWVLDLILNRN